MRKLILAVLVVLVFFSGSCSEVNKDTTDTCKFSETTKSTSVTRNESIFSSSDSKAVESNAYHPAPTYAELVSEPKKEIDNTLTEKPSSSIPALSSTSMKTTLPKEEIKQKETTTTVNVPKEHQNTNVAETKTSMTSAVTSDLSKETLKSEEHTSSPTSEGTIPKSAYDYEFDISIIRSDCIGIGKDMGLRLDSSLSPNNATWWNPVTASQNNQGSSLRQSLNSYIRFHTLENLYSYGIDQITSFNIYCEARENGAYLIYFLFA